MKKLLVLLFTIGFIFVSCDVFNSNTNESESTSELTGYAMFNNSANHSNISIEVKSNGSVVKSTSTDSSGLYLVDGLVEGNYTVTASSVNSKEKTVHTSVLIDSRNSTASDLELTAIGHISGRITIDDSASGNLGVLVFVAGTSYVAMTDDSGDFVISDVPVGNNYSVVISKDGYMIVWDTVDVATGNTTSLNNYNISSANFTDSSGDSAYDIWLSLGNEGTEQDFIDSLQGTDGVDGTNGIDGLSIIWKGSLDTAPDNPELNWAYYNSIDGISYIYDGSEWTILAIDGLDGEDCDCCSDSDLVFVSGGIFTQSEGFEHTISDFYISKYETTYELWYEVYTWALNNGYSFANAGIEGHDGVDGAETTEAKLEPVTTINWRDSIVWCNAYSEKDGLTPVYRNNSNEVIKDSRDSNATECDNTIPNWSANGYRLPTEGEWQYAASGGSLSNSYIYSGSNTIDDVAWYYINSDSKTHDVGGKQANELGIYDMSGNVWEWCYDWYGNYPDSNQTDYTGASSGSYRVEHGGGWALNSSGLVVSDRGFNNPSVEGYSIGFRVVSSIIDTTDIPLDGLVAEYLFNGDANDTSGNDNHGTVNGATLTADRDGNSDTAYSFDGVDDYIRNDSFTLTVDDFTLSIWISKSSTPDWYRMPIAIHSGGGGIHKGDATINLTVNNTDIITGLYTTFDGSTNDTTSSGVILENNEWYHIVYTRLNNEQKIYINNSEMISLIDTEGSYSITDGFLEIGAPNFWDGSWSSNGRDTAKWEGLIDDIRLYNRSLNINEINILYNE